MRAGGARPGLNWPSARQKRCKRKGPTRVAPPRRMTAGTWLKPAGRLSVLSAENVREGNPRLTGFRHGERGGIRTRCPSTCAKWCTSACASRSCPATGNGGRGQTFGIYRFSATAKVLISLAEYPSKLRTTRGSGVIAPTIFRSSATVKYSGFARCLLRVG